MLVATLLNLVNLNIGYFINLIAGNMFWVFGFAAAAYYFRETNFWLRLFTTISVVYGMMDIQNVHGLHFFVAGALLVLCLGRIVVITAVAKTRGGSKYIPLSYAMVTYSVLFYFNFFA